MEEEYNNALTSALRMLNYCDRTELEIRKKLADKNIDASVIEQVIEKLVSDGFINDRRYAEYYVTCYSGKRSRRRIVNELSAKGISDIIIEEYADSCDNTQAIKNALSKQLRRRGITDIGEASFDELRKIAAALYRQGYDREDINKYIMK